MLVTDGWGIWYEIVLMWFSLDLTDDKSTLLQAVAWCHKAPSHCLSQCWPRSMLPYGITKPQWVKRQFSLTINSFTPSRDDFNLKCAICRCILMSKVFPVKLPQNNIGSGKGLVPSCCRLLLGPMLTCSMMLYGITRGQWVNTLKF